MVVETEDTKIFSYDELTGEYQTYTYVRSVVAPTLGDLNNKVIYVDNLGMCITQRYGSFTPLVTIDYLGIVTSFPNVYVNFATQSNFLTANRKYLTVQNIVVATTFEVYRRGVQMFTRNTALDDVDSNLVINVGISPNGRFIWVCVRSIATGFRNRYMLYEGT